MSDDNIDIKVDNIEMLYGSDDLGILALENLDFAVERGSLFCIVGPSGCGKTTLLRLIIGLLTPTKGTIYVEPNRKKEGIAYVQQVPFLLPWRTALQNACLGAEIRAPLDNAIIDRVKYEIRNYGLGGFENSLAKDLSGGMKQRVALISALCSSPKILLCDEPFSSIDFVTRLQLNTVFKMMCRLCGITTLFVTHNIEEAIFLGDTIAVMRKRPGRIISYYKPELSTGAEDAVKCRSSPEYPILFAKIWKDLAYEDKD